MPEETQIGRFWSVCTNPVSLKQMFDLTCSSNASLCISKPHKVGIAMASGEQKSPPQTQRLQIYPNTNSGVSPFWRGNSLSIWNSSIEMKKKFNFFVFSLQKSMKERPRGIGMFSTSATRTGLVFLSTCVCVLC